MYPDLFDDFILRLGGMWTIMSFVGSIGTVIRNKGIGKVLKAAFGGSMKIFTGKKFP